MLSYIALLVPTSCITLSKPLPIYTTKKQLRIIDNKLLEVSILSYYIGNNDLLYELITNPVNFCYAKSIIDRVNVDKTLDIVARGATNYTIAFALLQRIRTLGFSDDKRANAARLLTQQYPQLIDYLRSNPLSGLYHLTPEVCVGYVDKHTNNNELLHLYKLGKLSREDMSLLSLYNASKELVDLLVVEDPVTDIELIIYYRYYNKLPSTLLSGDPALVDYFRLLQGLEPLCLRYDNCCKLVYVIHHDYLFDESVLLYILKRVNRSTFSTLNNPHYGYPRSGVHKVLLLAILNHIIEYVNMEFIHLDNCKLCQRVKALY